MLVVQAIPALSGDIMDRNSQIHTAADRSPGPVPNGAHARQRRSGEDVARLVRSARFGDKRAWDALVEEFSGLVWAVARAHRLSADDAADVAQVTWLRLVGNLDGINQPERVGAWLATTARRECLRVLRVGSRDVLSDEDPPDRESADPGPGNAVVRAERNEVLWRCFRRLPQRDQSLLRLLLTDPRPPYEEIAAALDMPIGSIGPTRARALERLRRELERDDQLDLMTD
jgi:RNA polymerase sigma factor (sigma-70 family)